MYIYIVSYEIYIQIYSNIYKYAIYNGVDIFH